jgi:mono/diheme cytochrome c family protein
MVVVLLTVSAGPLLGQQHNYTPGDIEEGGRLYRINCIGCHGPEGNLVGGIDLGRNRFRRVSSDDEIVEVIMNGVPGTGMPPNAIVRLRAYNVVAYLRSMNATSGVKSIAAATGDAGRGKVLFEGKGTCSTCHRVFGQGSRSGPDLSEAGLMLRAIEIETSILDPDARISTASPPFRVVKKDGTVISVSLNKSDLRESGLLKSSPMPSYRDRFSPQELADLIAYVGALRGAEAQ